MVKVTEHIYIYPTTQCVFSSTSYTLQMTNVQVFFVCFFLLSQTYNYNRYFTLL